MLRAEEVNVARRFALASRLPMLSQRMTMCTGFAEIALDYDMAHLVRVITGRAEVQRPG